MAVSPGGRWRVEVTGFKEMMDKLREADKKAATVLFREITVVGKDVASQASYLTPAMNPLSGWGTWIDSDRGRDISYDGGAAAAGFRLRRSNFRSKGISRGIGFSVQQMNWGGAVYEVIGDGSRVRNRAGRHLVNTVNDRFGVRRPRTLFKAYYDVLAPDRINAIKEHINDEIIRLGLR